MHFSRASLALLAAGLASAQLPNLPACSLNCFVSALTSDGCSSLTDYACHCQKPQLVSDVTPCVQSACNVADQSSVSSAVVSQCSAAGHAISVPPVSAASTTTGTTTTTESSTQTVTSTSTGTSTATSTGTSSTTPSSSSPSSSQHHSSSSASTTTTSTSTESTTKTTSASASATTTLSNNVASNKANVAGVAAVAAAALYVL